jgi:hypothetical protein
METTSMMILRDDSEANGWQVFYAIFTVAVLAAGVLTVLAMIGVSRRSGGLGIPGMIGLAVAGLGVVASIIAWAVPLWMGLLGIGLLVFGGAALNNGVAPKRSTMLASSGFIIGFILWVALNASKVGAVDSYGDYHVAWATSDGDNGSVPKSQSTSTQQLSLPRSTPPLSANPGWISTRQRRAHNGTYGRVTRPWRCYRHQP